MCSGVVSSAAGFSINCRFASSISSLQSRAHKRTDGRAAIANDVDDIEEAKITLDALQAEAIADGSPTFSPLDLDDFKFQDDENDFEGKEHDGDDSDDDEDDENVRFLKVSFPNQSVTTIRFILSKCGNDMSKSIDELLNRDFIEEEKRLNAIIDGAEPTTLDDFVHSTPKKQKRGRKSKAHLPVDAEEDDSPTTASRWTQMSNDVAWLSQALDLPIPTVQSSYHAHHSSLPASLNALLESSPPKSDEKYDAEVKGKGLVKSYPALGPLKVTQILNATKGNVALANKVAQVLIAWRPVSVEHVTSTLQSTKLAPPTQKDVVNTSQDDGDGKSLSECRNLAQVFSEKRDAAFRQAAEAYQRSKSDGLMGGSAMYYSQLGRDYDRQRQIYKMRAAELSSTQKSGDRDALDLHGLNVHESLVIVKHAVTDWYSRTRMLESGALMTPLKIVTGLGRHSTGGEARLLPAIKKYLDRDGWHYEVSGGQILVVGLAKKK